MATFDCPQVYLPSQPDIHVSADFSPKSISHPPFAAPHSPPDQTETTSLSLSEPTSTTFGSDNERVFSSGDEDSLEFQSDTAYDSVASRTTMNEKSGSSGLEIERLFEEASPRKARKPLVPLSGLPSVRGSTTEPPQPDQTLPDHTCNFPTPRNDRAADSDIIDLATPIATRSNHRNLNEIPSSPPPKPDYGFLPSERSQILPASSSEKCAVTVEEEDLWGQEINSSLTFEHQFQSPDLPRHQIDMLGSPPFEPNKHLNLALDECLEGTCEERRLSIFDWSEQPRSERDSLYGSSPRLRTMHSKQANESRGGRPSGRRAPNALHLRSQSVPVAKEPPVDSNYTHLPAKFGTWGLGNKGVSEEWTDDFDFDEGDSPDAPDNFDRFAAAMKVPQAIIDRQASVHGQFGLVQEFMLLVEELRRLRHQASMLDLLQGSHRHLWEDAESIINLATLNDEDDAGDEALLASRSPRFSGIFDDFDEISSPINPSRQHSVPDLDDGSAIPSVTMLGSTSVTPPAGRARGESLAQAKTFLQNMHQNRRGIESSPFQDPSHPPKLPFDTQDLRDLVSRTGAVTRSLKDIIRKAEGVVVSPARLSKGPQDPPFSQIFHRPRSTSPDAQRISLSSPSNIHSYVREYMVNSNSQSDQLVHMGAGTEL